MRSNRLRRHGGSRRFGRRCSDGAESSPFAALAALAGSAALGIMVMPSALTNAGDPWTDVAWGKFFVAITYASIAVACVIALEQRLYDILRTCIWSCSASC